MDLALNNLQRLIYHETQTPTNQPIDEKYTTPGQFFSGVQLVWIQFSFLTVCLTKAKEAILPYNLPIAEGGGSEERNSYFSKGNLCDVKRKQSRP